MAYRSALSTAGLVKAGVAHAVRRSASFARSSRAVRCCIGVGVLHLVGSLGVASAARPAPRAGSRAYSTMHSMGVATVTAPDGHANVEVMTFDPPPSEDHTATMILTHGLGDTAAGWADAVSMFYGPALPYFRFVLPTAPSQPVTLNMGMRMPSWYDIVGLSDRYSEECEGIEQSRALLLELIQQEVDSGIPMHRIVLAGFSQGGALSLYTGLQLEEPVGAMVIKSAYLACPKTIEERINKEAVEATPVIFCHGDSDPMVLPEWGKRSMEQVKEWGSPDVRWHEYPGMQHSACEEELRDVVGFVQDKVPPLSL